MRNKLRVLASIGLILFLLAGFGLGWRYFRAPMDMMVKTQTEAEVASPKKPPLSAVTTVTVEHPKIRIVDSTVALSEKELLDDNFSFFDTSKLTILRPRALYDEAHHRIFLTEMVNNSTDAIVLNPAVSIVFFNGHKQVGKFNHEVASYLYPHQRVPLSFSDFEEYTDLKIAWPDMKAEKLPGPRPRMNVVIDQSQAKYGSVLVNFSDRYQYKYIDFTGHLENLDDRNIDGTKVRISLYDSGGLLTGFGEKTLRSIHLKAKDRMPFELSIKQFGPDFVRYETAYEEVKL